MHPLPPLHTHTPSPGPGRLLALQRPRGQWRVPPYCHGARRQRAWKRPPPRHAARPGARAHRAGARWLAVGFVCLPACLPAHPPTHPPTHTIALQGGRSLDTSALSFRNNYAMNQGFAGMPDRCAPCKGGAVASGGVGCERWCRGLPLLRTPTPSQRAPPYLHTHPQGPDRRVLGAHPLLQCLPGGARRGARPLLRVLLLRRPCSRPRGW